MYDTAGQVQASLTLGEGVGSHLADLALRADGSPYLRLRDAAGRPLWGAP